jgi:hypothetical protein
VYRSSTNLFRHRGSRVGRSIWVAILAAVFLLGILLVAAGSARAAATWSGKGTFEMTSTPGSCYGSGTGSIELSGGGGSATGTLTATMGSIDEACASYMFSGTITDPIQLTQSSDSDHYDGTDSGGDQIALWYQDGQVILELTPGGSGGGGGSCALYCSTLYTFTFTGSGDLFGADLYSTTSMAAMFGGFLGAIGLVAGLGSLRPPRFTPGTTEGASYDASSGSFVGAPPAVPGVNPNAVTFYSNRFTATPAGPPSVAPDSSPGYPISGGGLPLSGTGGFVGPPDYWSIVGGQPPPNAENEPRTGQLFCPIHHVVLLARMVSYGPMSYLRWECPVGPHLPWG